MQSSLLLLYSNHYNREEHCCDTETYTRNVTVLHFTLHLLLLLFCCRVTRHVSTAVYCCTALSMSHMTPLLRPSDQIWCISMMLCLSGLSRRVPRHYNVHLSYRMHYCCTAVPPAVLELIQAACTAAVAAALVQHANTTFVGYFVRDLRFTAGCYILQQRQYFVVHAKHWS